MKATSKLTAVLMGGLLLGSVGLADDIEQPIEILAPVEKVFLPTGFDNNDNAEVILHGEFPTSCYKVGHSSFEVDRAAKVIKVALTAYEYKSSMCTQALTPYVESIHVGVLAAGVYRVEVAGSDIKESIRIGRSVVSSPDQYIYAQVDSARLINLKSFDETVLQKIEIEGNYPHTFVGCAVMDRVDIIHVRDDILEVLPILKLLENDPVCERHANSFVHEVEVNSELFGEGLLHVRSINGSSFNRVVNGL